MTDFHLDSEVYSSDRRFRLVAEHTGDPTDPDFHRFESAFRFRLFDSQQKDIPTWEFQGEEAEFTPLQMHLDDSGFGVIRCWLHNGEFLIGITPQGERFVHVNITPPPPENVVFQMNPGHYVWQDIHIQDTDRGAFSSDSFHYFITLNQSLYFVTRTHWSRRLIINLTTGQLIDNDEQFDELVLACKRQEIKMSQDQLAYLSMHPELFQLYQLSEQPEKTIDDDYFLRAMEQLKVTAYLAGRFEQSSALRHLCQFEAYDLYSYEATSLAFGFDSPIEMQVNDTRALIQHVIHALGSQCEGYPSFQFFNDETELLYGSIHNRIDSFEQINPGSTAEEILLQLGSPNWLINTYSEPIIDRTETWLFDAYDPKTNTWSTLRILWGFEGMISVNKETTYPHQFLEREGLIG